MTLQHLLSSEIRSEHCPRFLGCNAPLCPLDADWRKRRHLPGEAVCGMALEAVKHGAEARFSVRGWGELYSKVVGAIPELVSRSATLKYAIERASRSGSKMDARLPKQPGAGGQR